MRVGGKEGRHAVTVQGKVPQCKPASEPKLPSTWARAYDSSVAGGGPCITSTLRHSILGSSMVMSSPCSMHGKMANSEHRTCSGQSRAAWLGGKCVPEL